MEISMKSKTVMSAILAMSLAAGGSAFAQDRGDRNDRSRKEQVQRADRDDGRHSDRLRYERGAGPDRAFHRADRIPAEYRHRNYVVYDRHDSRRDARWRDGRGAGPIHAYHRGDRFPAEYRRRNYVVNDWRGHHLSAPPRGYQWVQSGADYVLVAVASGIILQLLLNN